MPIVQQFPILTGFDNVELVAFKMKNFDFWCPSMQIPILSNMIDERPGKDLKQRKEKSMQ